MKILQCRRGNKCKERLCAIGVVNTMVHGFGSIEEDYYCGSMEIGPEIVDRSILGK